MADELTTQAINSREDNRVSYSDGWNDAVLIEKIALKRAVDLMSLYGDQVSATVLYENNISIEFSNLDDLTEIQNSKSMKVKKIHIKAEDVFTNSRVKLLNFSLEIANSSFDTIRVSGASSIEKTRSFVADIDDFFEYKAMVFFCFKKIFVYPDTAYTIDGGSLCHLC